MRQSEWIGKTLGGRYKIEEILGQGGMSAVYKATDPNLRRVVAIKMIHAHLSHDPGFVRRFEEEAAAVAQLRHPNIIQVYDFNHENETYYMVLEFVPGETLQDHLRRLNAVGRQIPIKDVLNYAIEVCEAADYAHQRGLIHRDIKPANVMLSIQGNAILMDFGIAKIIGGQQHTATGAVVGTAMYMSPEQIKGETPDRRSDIYSLGVMLFEMVSGRPPFEADSAMTLMMMHVNDPVPNLFEIIPTCEPDIVAIINKALAKNPDDRFQTAAQMAGALAKVLERMKAEEGSRVPDFTLIEPPVTNSQPEENKSWPDAEEENAQPGMEGTLIEPPSPASARRPAASGQAASSDVLPAYRRASTPHPYTPPPESIPRRKIKLTPALLGGGAVVLVGLICIIAGGAFLLNRFGNSANRGIAPPVSTTEFVPTQVAEVVAQVPTSTQLEVAAEPSSTAAETIQPSQPPTSAPTIVPTQAQPVSATIPPGLTYYTRINSISIDENGNYVVDYETFGYTETLPGMHVHFFFNTVPPDQAGKPGKGPWILYGGPRPFTKYKVSDRPDGATQMCILVANPDHSVQPNSGNCVDLPDVPQTGSSEATPQITMDNYDVPMVFIPGGEFTMGSDSGDPDEKPVHTVSVNDFYIDEFEVTNSQYARCVDESYCDPPSDTSSATRDSYYGNPDFSKYPVVFVSWQDANEFCEWRGARLPTEAEWEKAARGTDGRTYPWGEDISCEMTNYNNCVGDTTEVGYYPSDVSPYGVYDMAGNVREVVADLYDVYPGGDPSASMDFGSDMVVARGGWFKGNAGQSRAANRTSRAKDEAHNLVGFRCARDGN